MKEFKYFSIFNYEEEQAYLRRMHKAGWKFTRVTGLGMYHFLPCEPEDVVYQLDYNQEAHKDMGGYIQMFRDCGWEYIQDYAGYSYFRKAAAAPGSEEIFCDDESRLLLMQRVFRGRLLPLVGLFSACLLPQFIMNLSRGNYGVVCLLGAVIGLYLGIFAVAAVKYRQYKNKARQ